MSQIFGTILVTEEPVEKKANNGPTFRNPLTSYFLKPTLKQSENTNEKAIKTTRRKKLAILKISFQPPS